MLRYSGLPLQRRPNRAESWLAKCLRLPADSWPSLVVWLIRVAGSLVIWGLIVNYPEHLTLLQWQNLVSSADAEGPNQSKRVRRGLSGTAIGSSCGVAYWALLPNSEKHHSAAFCGSASIPLSNGAG